MRRSVALLAAAASSVAAQNSTITCADGGLYIIVARGSGEVPGTGLTGTLADDVAKQVKGTEISALDYPATFTDYLGSVQKGGMGMSDAVTQYHEKCPDDKIAVMGWSQGAEVTMDAFCGGSSLDKNVTTVPKDVVDSSVVAIVLFGDPSHDAKAPYNKGTSVKNGIFARENITACEQLGSRLVSYCDKRDQYCDAQNERNEVHSSYFTKYGKEVVSFVVDRYDNATKTSTGANSTASAAPSSSATSTGTSSGTATATQGQTTQTGGGSSGAAGVVPGLGLLSMGLVAAWALL